MDIIAQKQLFSWQDVENIGDLERLVLVLQYLPDGEYLHPSPDQATAGKGCMPNEQQWNFQLR